MQIKTMILLVVIASIFSMDSGATGKLSDIKKEMPRLQAILQNPSSGILEQQGALSDIVHRAFCWADQIKTPAQEPVVTGAMLAGLDAAARLEHYSAFADLMILIHRIDPTLSSQTMLFPLKKYGRPKMEAALRTELATKAIIEGDSR